MPGLTIPHLVDFGPDAEVVGRDLARPEAWDALRTRTSGPFAMAGDRAAWDAEADARPEIGERMERLAAVLRAERATRVASYGVGGALPERWLLRAMPELDLVLTDYGAETISGLHRIADAEATVVHHDLLADSPIDADLHLFHRIDTEFRNRQWRRIMRRFAAETIILVATDVVPAQRMREELRAMPHRRHWTRAGWMRTRGAFERLWRRTHRAEALDLGDLEAWLLRPRG